MKKLLIITGGLLLAGLISCDNDRSAKNESDTGTTSTMQQSDSVTVAPISAAVAKEMIRYYKSDSMNTNRAKLFRGGIDVSKLTSILKDATRFNIYAAAYPGNFGDSSKRNMPTFVLQVMKSTSTAESEITYYAVEKETFCPPPPICTNQIEIFVD